MSTAIIISGGNIETDFALGFLHEQTWDYLIAADRGLVFLKNAGIKPTHIVGDFDSADKALPGLYEGDPSVEIRYFRPEKDDTDTSIALQLALELGCRQIYLLGCTGTRVDHMMAAVRDLRYALEAGASAWLLDSHNRIRLIDQDTVILRKEQFGKYISLFPFAGPVSGLTLRGFAYPLADYRMEADSALGVSNELTQERGEISFRKGRMLVIESRD